MGDIVILKINDSQYNVLIDLIVKQSKERKEQFATMLCSTKVDDDGSTYLEADGLEEWSKDNLTQTETTVEPISWDFVTSNIDNLNMATDYKVSTVVSIHTHPEWCRTNHELDDDDRETFINWTRAFRNGGIDMINGIMSRDGMKFYRWNERTQSFENVVLQVEDRLLPSTLPENIRQEYITPEQISKTAIQYMNKTPKKLPKHIKIIKSLFLRILGQNKPR